MSIKIVTASGGSNTATLVLATVDGLEVGETIRVYNTGQNKIDGRHVIATITTATKTITYPSNSIGTIVAFNPPNASLVELVTWATADDVGVFLGIDPATTNDSEWLDACVEAGNDYAFRVRQEAGYTDSKTVIPSPSVKEGTVLYCGTLYRERGSVDSFASFDQLGTATPFGSMARIKQLLGVGRPQVG